MDVKRILERARVDFITEGKNVKAGNIYIHCPYCGDDDPSHHLGINETTGAWGCWRNAGHRGRSLEVLMVRLIGDSARSLFDEGATSLPDDFESAVASITEDAVEESKPLERIDWPDGSTPIVDMSRRSIVRSRILEYLRHERGIDDPVSFCHYYQLHYCAKDWAHRILMPIYETEHKMIGWTGRAIGPAQIRYKAWPPGEAVKQCLFNYDQAVTEDEVTALIITEGPFDALKLDWYTSHRARTIAIMSTAATPAQRRLIIGLVERYGYRRVIILLDAETIQESSILAEQLAPIHPAVGALPSGFKDPGELGKSEAMSLVRDLTQRG